jgi:hypothetical protein
VKIGDTIRRLLVRQHQAKRGLEAQIAAAFQEREIVVQHRQRVLEAQLDEPSYIEIRRNSGGYGDY